MSARDGATRRLFFMAAGGALAAPTAAVTAASAGESLQARLARHEDLAAIRALTADFVRRLNAGQRADALKLFAEPREARLDPSIRRMSVDLLGEPEALELDARRGAATARADCIACIETELEGEGTLVQMARAQGEGVVRREQRGVLETAFVKRDGVWKIARAELREA